MPGGDILGTPAEGRGCAITACLAGQPHHGHPPGPGAGSHCPGLAEADPVGREDVSGLPPEVVLHERLLSVAVESDWIALASHPCEVLCLAGLQRLGVGDHASGHVGVDSPAAVDDAPSRSHPADAGWLGRAGQHNTPSPRTFAWGPRAGCSCWPSSAGPCRAEVALALGGPTPPHTRSSSRGWRPCSCRRHRPSR
jgi:hypothetical protein